jgi:hypothetical protein
MVVMALDHVRDMLGRTSIPPTSRGRHRYSRHPARDAPLFARVPAARRSRRVPVAETGGERVREDEADDGDLDSLVSADSRGGLASRTSTMPRQNGRR